MLRRFHEGLGKNSVTCWGTGRARREFLYVDDFADACIFLMNTYSGAEPVNIGHGRDWSMGELAALVASVTGYSGDIVWDAFKPEGTAQRLLDNRVLREFGWMPKTCLLDGLQRTYKDFLKHL